MHRCSKSPRTFLLIQIEKVAFAYINRREQNLFCDVRRRTHLFLTPDVGVLNGNGCVLNFLGICELVDLRLIENFLFLVLDFEYEILRRLSY